MAYNMKVGIKAGSALVGGALAYSTKQPLTSDDCFRYKSNDDGMSQNRQHSETAGGAVGAPGGGGAWPQTSFGMNSAAASDRYSDTMNQMMIWK